jgi:hypothetical protein
MSIRVVRASVLTDSLISLVDEIRDNYPGIPVDSPTPLCVSISQASIRMIYIELNLATEDTEITEEIIYLAPICFLGKSSIILFDGPQITKIYTDMV